MSETCNVAQKEISVIVATGNSFGGNEPLSIYRQTVARGLTSTWGYPIYCSEITGKLLVQRFEVKEDLIHTLEVGTPTIIYLDDEHIEQMTVTALDANHCPGAIMLLMEGYFGNILYTGDFRYHTDMIQGSLLSRYTGKIDFLYLDNTYCSPTSKFPARDTAANDIMRIIEEHPDDDVVIGVRKLGKELLLYSIAQHFQERVSVPWYVYQTCELLGISEVFSYDPYERIRAIPFNEVTNNNMRRMNGNRPTIAIQPTSLFHGTEDSPYKNNPRIYTVPYSDHSSYIELLEFVEQIKPSKIIPIVKGSPKADMSCFDNFLNREWNDVFYIPESVKAFKSSRCFKVLPRVRQGKKRKIISYFGTSRWKKVARGVEYRDDN